MTASTQHELVLVREFDAPREKIYKAWTDPDLLKQWFVPRPWGVAEATLDVRPGGSSVVVMHDPEGNQYPNRGVYLEIVENEKIVFTDAYTSAWVPAEKPFFTGVILLEDLGNGRTKYGPRRCTGAPRTRKHTRRWVSTKDGARLRTNWRSCWRRCER